MNIIDSNYFDLSILVAASMVTGVLFSKLSIWIAKKLNIIDYPGRNPHNIHQTPIPRAGGLAFILSLVLILLATGFLFYPEISIILLPSIVIFIFGIIDDRFGMQAWVKLAGQILAVTILVSLDVRVRIFENPNFLLKIGDSYALGLDIFITYFWLIGVTNAFNMIDSIDGLVIGLVWIYSGIFIFMAMISGQIALVVISTILFGSAWGISFFNQQPAKLFLGDSGAQSIGFLLALIVILYRPVNAFQSSSWLAPIILFSAPIFDTTLVSLSRIRRGVPFYNAGLDHTYHRLVKLGWSTNRVVGLIHFVAGLMSFVSVAITYTQPLVANGFFLGWLIVFFGLIYYLENNFSTL